MVGRKLPNRVEEDSSDLRIHTNTTSNVRLQNNSSRSMSHMRLKFFLMDCSELMRNQVEMEKKMATPIFPPLRKINENISRAGVSGKVESGLPLCKTK